MDDRIRVSDADRDKVATRLREHFAEGRLTADELDERLATTLSAKTFGDIRPVMADLPEPAPAAAARAVQAAGPRRAHHRGPRFLPLAGLVLLTVLVLRGGAWGLLGLLRVVMVVWLVAGLCVFVAARRFRRHIHRSWPR